MWMSSLSVEAGSVEITASAETTAQTGVEMEAFVGATVAALTVYDMAKAVDDGMELTEVRLVEKTKGAGVKAAVLTVSDGVDMGTREDASGDLLEELLRGEGYEVVRRVVPDERDSIAEAIEELAVESEARADDRRHRARPAGRDAGGDDDRPRARRARASPRRSAPTRSRRRRTRCCPAGSQESEGRRSSSTCPARPVAAATGSPSSSRHSSTRCGCLPARRPPTARRDRRRVSQAVRLAREDRAHGLRAPVRLRGRVPRRRRRAERARPLLDHRRDGRSPLACDGAEPADRRRASTHAIRAPRPASCPPDG